MKYAAFMDLIAQKRAARMSKTMPSTSPAENPGVPTAAPDTEVTEVSEAEPETTNGENVPSDECAGAAAPGPAEEAPVAPAPKKPRKGKKKKEKVEDAAC